MDDSTHAVCTSRAAVKHCRKREIDAAGEVCNLPSSKSQDCTYRMNMLRGMLPWQVAGLTPRAMYDV